MQITSGKVTFSRTIQPADYESKSVSTEVSFVVDEAEDIKEVLATVHKLVKDQTLIAIGRKRKRAQ